MRILGEFKTHRVFYLFFAIFLFLFLFVFHAEVVMPDGMDNMATVRSIVFDRDLNLYNEMYEILKGEVPDPIVQIFFPVTEDGSVRHGSPIGGPLLLIPFEALCHLYLWVLNEKYFPLLTGLEPIYMIFCSWGSFLYGMAAVFLVYFLCRTHVSERGAVWGCLLVWLGSNFLCYATIHGLFSHIPSAFLVSLFLLLSLSRLDREPEKGMGRIFFLGVVGGLMTATRQENGVFLMVPFFSGLFWREGFPPLPVVTGAAKRIALYLMGGFAGIFPYLYQLKVTFGKAATVPFQESFLLYTDPKLIQILFSPYHGLFYWSPVLLLSLIGFVVGWIRFPRLRRVNWALLVCFLVQLYVFSIVNSWWAGLSFGARRFVNLFPVFVFFTAQFADGIRRTWVLASLLVVGTLWNLSLLIPFILGRFPREALVTAGDLFHAQWETVPNLPAYSPELFNLSMVAEAGRDPHAFPFLFLGSVLGFLLARGLWGFLRGRPGATGSSALTSSVSRG